MKAKIIKVVAAIIAATTVTGVYAKGGTAKPPTKGAVAPFTVPTPPDPQPTGGDWTKIHQFDVTGFIQDAVALTQGGGGTLQVNGITITIPANSIVQMPANTLSWFDAVNLITPCVTLPGATTPCVAPTSPPPLSLKNVAYPSFEAHVIGNVVNGQYIAGLVYLSQQSLNSGQGVITRIDYATGDIWVGSTVGGLDQVRLQINDPFGRFGRAQSPDARFSVDDQNPTIHAASGYPMCVPRTDPATADDLLCPQKNRPLAVSGCRNFSVAGIQPPISGELRPPAVGQKYCSQFLMKAPNTTANAALVLPTNLAGPTDPDALQQAPFEVGDDITYQGTLMIDPANPLDATKDYISAHTIEANVSIFTHPGTQPTYLAIGEFGVGTADPVLVALSGVPQETKDRIFLEALTTDVKTPVDIYMLDVDPTTGAVSNRWVTPYEMTGECNPALPPLAATCYGSSGGITTQNAGPNPTRARIRATKAITGILSGPSRNMRVMVRSLCPLVGVTPSAPLFRPYDQAALDACVNNAPLVANGLKAGQYFAPNFGFMFPEAATPGLPLVPNDLWHLPFLQFGEGPGLPPPSPTPW